jgi:hypothetical protein
LRRPAVEAARLEVSSLLDPNREFFSTNREIFPVNREIPGITENLGSERMEWVNSPLLKSRIDQRA